MTTYRPRVVEGCVVNEFEAWQAGNDGRPVREVVHNITRIYLYPADDILMNVVDAQEDPQMYQVRAMDYVWDLPGGRIAVAHPADFEAEYEESIHA